MPFNTERSELESGVLILQLSGTMTMGPQLQELEKTVDASMTRNVNKILIDMSDVTYLDSSAIGVLVGCTGKLKNAGGQCRLAGVTDRVQTIFKITSAHYVLATDQTSEEALAALTSVAGSA